ncbi:MAG: nicotinate phosphoribosyltransferase [Elusimicrobiaceae bacterium]|nr:nicotinate phosphoribosyltransferase [Elusimicrobiaceae bacterium]
MLISSLLDNDLYKFTMMQAVFHNFPAANAEYALVCRNHEHARYLPEIAPALEAAVRELGALRLDRAEKDYLAGLKCFRADFLEFLTAFSLKPEQVRIEIREGNLSVRIEGPWLQTILFEVPLLALVNELFYAGRFKTVARDALPPVEKLRAAGVKFSDFGTRRRVSFEHQRRVLDAVREFPGFGGTSNVLFAMLGNMPAVGTMAHEYLQAGQAFYGPRAGQREMLKLWLKEHGGQFAVALTDVIDTDGFLADFGPELAAAYSGVRHDSGDPLEWGRRILEHYRAFGIDPKTKTLVFSDMVTPEKAAAIAAAFGAQANVLFGIGSWLDNNIGLPRLNSVIKMVRCNGRPVAKITNTAAKTVAEDADYLRTLRTAYSA